VPAGCLALVIAGLLLGMWMVNVLLGAVATPAALTLVWLTLMRPRIKERRAAMGDIDDKARRSHPVTHP
jgi:hypothetical protein